MDAFAVSVGKGMTLKRVRPRHALTAGLWFGVFQGLMPLIGYFVGQSFAEYVVSVDHWIAFGLLTLIGVNMIREAMSGEEEEVDGSFGVRTMLVMAIATSIDAFAVGVAFAMEPIVLNERMPPLLNVLCICAVICLVTFTVCFAGVGLGNVFGSKHKSKAELAGGIVLIIIAFWGLIR